MAARYQVILKNQLGIQTVLFTEWSRLEIFRRLNSPDSHAFQIDGNLGEIADFVLDAQIEVIREDLAAVPVITSYREYEGFHRTEVRQTTGEGNALYTSHGVGYLFLLEGRHILFNAGTAQADKSGLGETIMKDFVTENAGPGATAPPRLFNGVFTGLTVQADGAAGTSWTGARAYRNLLEVVQEIAENSAVDFELVGTGAATFEFRAKATPLGADRTNVGLDPATGLNAAGNPPVVFALDFDNMISPIYSDNRRSERNAIIVLGQGIESDRVVIERSTPTDIDDSPWNRREVTRQANNESLVAGLNAIGDELLDQLERRQNLDFTVMQIPALLYGRDYFLGDLVTIRYQTVELNRQIIGVNITVAQGLETIGVILSNDS